MKKNLIESTANKDENVQIMEHSCLCSYCGKSFDEWFDEWIENYKRLGTKERAKNAHKIWSMNRKIYTIMYSINKGKYTDDMTQAIQQKRKEEVLQLAEKIENILESDKDTYKKKVALFNLVKNLEIGEPQPLKEQRINHLLQTRLYNDLAKKSMEEYKKTTMEAFDKAE